jgi:hypothetical protein
MNNQLNQSQQSNVDLSLINKSLSFENADSISSDNLAKLEEQRLLNDGKRGEEYRKHIHLIVVVGMYAVGLILISLTLIRAFHFVAPSSWRWLSDDDNHSIERIIFSSIILSLSTKYFKKYKVIEE